MAIDFTCVKCQKKLRVKDELTGKHGKCPKCGAPFVVPRAGVFEMSPIEEGVPKTPEGLTDEPEPIKKKTKPARRIPPSALIKAGIVTGVVMGVIAFVIYAVVGYYIGGRSKGAPGLLARVIVSIPLGAVIGALVGLVMVFTESLSVCVGVSAGTLAVVQFLLAKFALGSMGNFAAFVAAASGALTGAAMGYVIAMNTAKSLDQAKK